LLDGWGNSVDIGAYRVVLVFEGFEVFRALCVVEYRLDPQS